LDQEREWSSKEDLKMREEKVVTCGVYSFLVEDRGGAVLRAGTGEFDGPRVGCLGLAL
jgi:hypothetical protein